MQTLNQPQEIEVWYVIPKIRCEIAKELKGFGEKQTKIAEILGLTKSAVSQYLNDKRAKGLRFPRYIQEKIKVSAKNLQKNKNSLTQEIQKILLEIRKTKLLCKFHKQHSKVKSECTVCTN